MKGRFAPSPTGYIHLGNVWVALLSYLSTRAQEGRFILRMEDIDLQRSRKDFAEAILDDLEWLGISWDEGPRVGSTSASYYQHNRYDIYEEILREWQEKELVYPCFCSRSRIQEIASAPHEGEIRHAYDGCCSRLTLAERLLAEKEKTPSWRMRIKSGEYRFYDLFQGEQVGVLHRGEDDFIVKRADGMMAYNFAVAVDDALMGVTEVLRGYDLLESTFLQQLVLTELQKPLPMYAHVPLLKDSEGYRLSKRQQSITVRELKLQGITRGHILAYLGKLGNILPNKDSIKTCNLYDLLEGWHTFYGSRKEIILTKFDILI